MWQIAVFGPGQHEQFAAQDEQFVVSCSASDGRWTLTDGEARPLTATALRLRIEGDGLRVECHGVDEAITLVDGENLNSNTPAVIRRPWRFRVGDVWFDVRPALADASPLGLEPLHALAAGGPARAANVPGAALGPDAETVARWLNSVSRLHRTAACAPEFFPTAARLTLESTGLDAAMVLVRDGDAWQIAGSEIELPQHGVAFQPAALELVVEQPQVWRCAAPPIAPQDELTSESIVVAPVCNDDREVVAAVYGVRHGRGDNRRRGIRPLEARMVELMADAVATGMSRRRQEVETARQQLLLEQAFSPAVAAQLRRRPMALNGQSREVTMLFADLRRSTALAHDLPPADLYELLGELLELLTQAVMDHAGVVIDYYGDGLCAMWNAPLEVPDHADWACLAALEMLAELPDFSRRWQGRTGQPLELGIGMHAGEVLVGNAGTRRRIKYGPRGVVVNVTHRVQSATKTLDVPLLVTGAVRRRLSSRFVTLRVCKARLAGVDEAMDLFSVFPAVDGKRLQWSLDLYAQALSAFEQGDFDLTEQLLDELLAEGQATPAAFLAQQTAALRRTALARRATDQVAYTPDAVIEILAR